jgi:hypothetical protein
MATRKFPYTDPEKEMAFQEVKDQYKKGEIQFVDNRNNEELLRMQEEAIRKYGKE